MACLYCFCVWLEMSGIYPWRRHSWGGGFTAFCLPVYPHDIWKTILLESPNLTYKWSTIRHGNQFILGSKSQKSRLRVTKTLRAWVFALLWALASSGLYYLEVYKWRCRMVDGVYDWNAKWSGVVCTQFTLLTLRYIVHWCCSETVEIQHEGTCW